MFAICGDFGNFPCDIFARAAADEPKTSALTAYSIPPGAPVGGVSPISDVCRERANFLMLSRTRRSWRGMS